MPDAPHVYARERFRAGGGEAAAAVLVEGLSHRYPAGRRRGREQAPRPALDAVSLEVREGELFGVLGPNGGGKTTLFRILATLLTPTAGAVRIFGDDALRRPQDARRSLGVVFQMPSLDPRLTARENLLHQGHLYGLRGGDLRRRIDERLDAVGLLARAGECVERFSGGMRRRAEVAKAVLHDPRLLLLDEPATGLDPGARRDLALLLERLRRERGVTVALTTHLMEEADRCDRLAILAEGRLVALDTPARLKSRIGGDVIAVEPEPAADRAALAREIAARFAPWGDGAAPAVVDETIRMEREDGAAFVAALTQAFPQRIRRVSVGRPTLEDVFMHMTGRRLWEERAVQ